MQPIIYDVAVSIDGFIAGPSGDISKFAHEGPVVDDYLKRMECYGTAIMGRNTYEFGYAFGMQPGDNPYKHMETYVFSAQIELPEKREVSVVRGDVAAKLAELRAGADRPIYLCGGGSFAASLIALGQVDKLILKRAPVLLGGGVRLFGADVQDIALRYTGGRTYGQGYLLQEYDVVR